MHSLPGSYYFVNTSISDMAAPFIERLLDKTKHFIHGGISGLTQVSGISLTLRPNLFPDAIYYPFFKKFRKRQCYYG